MIRLMGILTGSAIAVGILILAVGVPDLDASRGAAGTDPEPVASEEPSDVSEPMAAPSPIEPVIDETESHSGIDERPGLRASTPPDPVPESTTAPVDTVEEPEPATERQWYAFWSPFRSEIAADGFVAQLQRTTGLDFRVIKLKPGVYEVAFAYADDTDIQDKLAQISTATGLDLSGG